MSEQGQEGRTPRIGDVIGRYRILEVIGRGSTGPVFRAWDESLSREVALKTLWPQYVAEEDVRRRFEREARAAARLDSPFVVRVHDIGEEDGVPFIAMEFLRAGPIISEKNATTMDWRRAAEIGRDVAAALAQAHAQGIIHRDIKPANVMLGADGRAKLADFGLARAVAEESIALTSAGSLLGTPAYLAPEVIEGNEASPLSDIYSLGVLLFRLVTGRLPFDASTAAGVLRGHLEGRFPRASTLVPGVPAALAELIAGCTLKDPEARYPGAEFVAEDLERLLAGETIVGPPKTTEAFRIEVPFWARFIPGAERTMMTVGTGVAAAEKRAKEAARVLEETRAITSGLTDKAADAEKNAAGWRAVAERAVTEERDAEAREALGYAQQYDEQARDYRTELEKTRTAEQEMRAAADDARTTAEAAAVKGKLLLNRRDRARLLLGECFDRRPVWLAAAVGLIVTVGAVWLGLNALSTADGPVANLDTPTEDSEDPTAFPDVRIAAYRRLVYSLEPVEYWMFDENENAPTARASIKPGDHDGILIGQPRRIGAAGRSAFGSAYSFDGLHDAVEIKSIADLVKKPAFSIAYWYDQRGRGPSEYHWGSSASLFDNDHGYSAIDNGNALFARLQFTGGVVRCESYPVIAGSGWHFVVITGSAGDPVRLYHDGVLVRTSSNRLSGTTMADMSCQFGNFHGRGGAHANASLDEIALFNKALTATDVSRLWRAAPPPVQAAESEIAAPRPRNFHGAVWDPVNNRLIIIGGSPYGGPELDDCWSYDNDGWKRLATAGAIPARHAHSAVWDDSANRVLVFGGWAMTKACGDLWELVSEHWKQLEPAGRAPKGRHRHSAVWDSSNKRMLVFGGDVFEGGVVPSFSDELWSFDGSRWIMLNPPGPRPEGRVGHTAVWDDAENRLLIFGGVNGERYLDDLWSFSNGRWTLLHPEGERPSARQLHACAWDSSNRRMLLFSGLGADNQHLADFWVFQAGRWRLVTKTLGSGGTPAPRRASSLTWDRTHGRALLFGGAVTMTSDDNDLWSFDGMNWERVE